jgi:riboflavin kinase
MGAIIITGRLAAGVGQATGFTRLDWVRAAFRRNFGIDPYPGTINLVVEDEAARAGWAAVKAEPGIVLHPPRTDWCDARLWRARIADRIPAAVVLPDVASYPERQIELVAAVRVRDVLALVEGDPVTIEVQAA